MTQDFYVYLHRRLSNGEVFYVGKGYGSRSHSLKSRSRYWHSIVKKHGYTVEIVACGLQEWYAFELEQELIAYYGRKDCGYGQLCNLTDGGEGSSGHVWSDELKEWRKVKSVEQMSDPAMRERLSKLKLGKKLSDEHAKKCSDNLRRVVDKTKATNSKLMKERWKDASFREKMTEMSKNFVMPESAKLKISKALSKPILRSDGEMFSSVTEAAKCLNKPVSKIAMAANGKRKTAYGYSWSYVSKEMQ